jgi:predicted amidohydrolase
VKLFLVQLNSVWENPGQNHERAAALLEDAASGGADTAVLPEMFSTGFSFDLTGLRSADESPTHEFLSRTAKELGINIVAGFKALPLSANKGLNLARAYSRDGSLLSTYEKIHPFSFACEHDFIKAGSAPVVFDLEGVPSSMFICYDLRFPEDFRKVASNVLLIFVLANWPESRQTHWEALLRARAIENQCFVAGVNRVGTDAMGIEYAGGSLVYDPLGEEVARGSNEESIVQADIDPAKVIETRRKFPFLDDMRL